MIDLDFPQFPSWGLGDHAPAGSINVFCDATAGGGAKELYITLDAAGVGLLHVLGSWQGSIGAPSFLHLTFEGKNLP